VLVDTEIIAAAPARFLVAGMGDALATHFEARAVAQSGKNNQVAGKPTIAATTFAELCYDILLEDGLKAKLAVSLGTVTPAVENIVEVNTLLSSVGFESGGLGAAHAIQKGFTHIPELHEVLHGEKVAFATLAQLVLEGAETDEIYSVLAFCDSVGLPITFEQLGCKDVRDEQLHKAAEVACVPNSTIHNMPFEVNPKMVYAALKVADEYGRYFLVNGTL